MLLCTNTCYILYVSKKYLCNAYLSDRIPLSQHEVYGYYTFMQLGQCMKLLLVVSELMLSRPMHGVKETLIFIVIAKKRGGFKVQNSCGPCLG